MIFGLALNLHDDVPAAARWVDADAHPVRDSAGRSRSSADRSSAAAGANCAAAGSPSRRCSCSRWPARWRRRSRRTSPATGTIYFEVVSVLLVVYTLGKVIGGRSRAAALAGSRAWAGQLETCRLVTERRSARDTCRSPRFGRAIVVEVNPGETIAVDGVIRDGIGLRVRGGGERRAVRGRAPARRPGSGRGRASHDAAFRIEATAAGTERQVDRLLAAVEEARDRPVSLQARADRLGRWFFPLVVVTAARHVRVTGRHRDAAGKPGCSTRCRCCWWRARA